MLVQRHQRRAGRGNDYLMNEILKGEDFDGFVEGDWTAVAEMRSPAHEPELRDADTASPRTASPPRSSRSSRAWTPR